MSVLSENQLAGASGQGGGYTLTESLRFRRNSNTYLSRTFGTPTSNTTWTWSSWNKLGDLTNNGNNQYLLGVTSYSGFAFSISNSLGLWNNAGATIFNTSNKFRDTTAWYHIMYVANGSSVKIYVNGELIYTYGSAPPTNINSANLHRIGDTNPGGSDYDGYMTEINFVDGQALTPSDFGEYDDTTGVWKPKEYTGTYGNNGFYLDMSTSGSTVLDQSGNGNNWTATNMNLTTSTATTYDKMTDVPTLTGKDTANFATINPLIGAGSVTVSLANLKSTAGTNAQRSNVSTLAVSSGKYYWETTWNQVGANDAAMTGIIGVANLNPNSNFGGTNSYAYVQDGGKQGAGSYTAGYGDRYVAGDVIGTALDLDGGTITFYRNGVSQGTAFSSLPSVEYYLGCSFYNSGDNFDINFGQRPFAYTPPTGYLKLNTYNLSDSTIKDGREYFDIAIWNGNGTARTIDNTITDASGVETGKAILFSPDLVWVKGRSNATYHMITDSVRGVTKYLYSNDSLAEGTWTDQVTSFNTSGVGFDLGVDTNSTVNYSGRTYVGWTWRGSDSTAATNSAGTNGASVDSTYSANTTSGFSIVTYTGTGSAITVYHGLGVAPACFIVKPTSFAGNWLVYHQGMGNDGGMQLNQTSGKATNIGYFNNTSPTSNTISLGIYGSTSSEDFVAYCFAEVEGFSKFGTYAGNGSTDGTFVYTGFRPAFIICKRYNGTDYWVTSDSTRNTYNQVYSELFPNDSLAEYNDPARAIDFVSNGFKFRNSDYSNYSGSQYIYMAFAENPFKNSLAR